MTTPIDKMLDAVEWTAAQSLPPAEGLYATHSGVLDLFGHKLKCHRLNNGQTVFDADDFEAFWNDGGLDALQ